VMAGLFATSRPALRSGPSNAEQVGRASRWFLGADR
jgi:hypothetical protein